MGPVQVDRIQVTTLSKKNDDNRCVAMMHKYTFICKAMSCHGQHQRHVDHISLLCLSTIRLSRQRDAPRFRFATRRSACATEKLRPNTLRRTYYVNENGTNVEKKDPFYLLFLYIKILSSACDTDTLLCCFRLSRPTPQFYLILSTARARASRTKLARNKQRRKIKYST